jgi:hypothetical protein
VYGADWTTRLPAEFARRRGYDILPVLYRLTVDGPDAARVRADYHRTLAEPSTSSSVTAGPTRRPTHPDWAGSSTPPVRSTTATRGGPRCLSSPGT